jgi:hypothetical protein
MALSSPAAFDPGGGSVASDQGHGRAPARHHAPPLKGIELVAVGDGIATVKGTLRRNHFPSSRPVRSDSISGAEGLYGTAACGLGPAATPRSAPVTEWGCQRLGDCVHQHRRTPFVFARGRTGQAPSIAGARSGLTDFTFHDLRHMTASQPILARATLQEVEGILGHADSNLTLRYAHLNPPNSGPPSLGSTFGSWLLGPVPKPVAGSDAGSEEGSRVDTRLVTAENHCTPP